MQLTASVDSAEFQKALQEIPKIAKRQLQKALLSSAGVIARQAQRVHEYNSKGGKLAESTQARLNPNNDLEAEIFFNEGIATYGKYQNSGAKPHRIYPKNKAALAFVKGGIMTVVPKKYNKYWQIQNATNPNLRVSKKGYVDHPGIKGDHFVEKAAKVKTPNFIAKINEAIQNTIKQAGF